MNESEAKTKWCPFTRYIGQVNGDAEMVGIRVDSTCCIASECMAWRCGCRTVGIHENEGCSGYCGLAGKP